MDQGSRASLLEALLLFLIKTPIGQAMRFTLSRDIYLTPDPSKCTSSYTLEIGSGVKFGQATRNGTSAATCEDILTHSSLDPVSRH